MSTFHVPRTVHEAVVLLDELGDAAVYGGGTAIQILLEQGLPVGGHLVDIGRIPGLRDIADEGEAITVGPMVSLRTMERDPRVRARVPLAAATYAKAAGPRVRNTASAGGNLALGDHRLDPPTALVVLDAVVELTSAGGRREVPVREFFVDFQVTARRPDEMITAIRIPKQPEDSRGAFVRHTSLAADDRPCASVAVLAVPGEPGAPTELRLGLGALAPTTRYVALDIGHDMSEQDVVDAALGAADTAIDPIGDVRGSAGYKAHLGRVAVEDGVRSVLKEVTGARGR